MQIEGLTVSSLAFTKPEDDYELYLHTVVDLDPEHEFATAPIGYDGPSTFMINSCERISKFYTGQSKTSPGRVDTPLLSPKKPYMPSSDVLGVGKVRTASEMTEIQLEQFITESPYFHALEIVRETGRQNPQALPSLLPSVIQQAQLLHGFRQHLGRIARQITHRFPNMNVLDLTFSKWKFSENILDGLQDTFASYHMPGDPLLRNSSYRCPSLQDNEKASFADLDLDAEPAVMAISSRTYDLVILDTSAFSRFQSSYVSIIRRVRRLMRNRGFIILVHEHAPVFKNGLV